MAEKQDTMAVVNGRLIIDVALTEGRLSESKKNLTEFTTGGAVKVGHGKLNMTFYSPVK